MVDQKLKHILRRLAFHLRKWRKLHVYIGLSILLFLIISSVTGILLAWKKQGEWIQPGTQKGVDTKQENWLPVHELSATAIHKAGEYMDSAAIDRIDVRPDKGIAKYSFIGENIEIQIDCTTGEIVFAGKRYSNFIESIHDGSIIGEGFKLISMNFLGFGLLFSGLSGFFLWYGPKRIRRLKKID